MVNTRGDLGKIPPMDNDGKSYIIPLDVYKEGYWAYNISNYFKARVGDNGTKFMVQWHEHGQLKNVLGLRPFLSGKVGQYSVDDSDPENPRVIMAADASTVDITGDTTDVREGGIAVYNMIEQGLPQSGIFYGAIGLRGVGADGRHQETSVDIAFKVLDNNVEMLGAKRFYISELEQALNELKFKIKEYDSEYQNKINSQSQKFRDDLNKELINLNDKINSEIKRAEDSLVLMQASMDENIASFNKLSTSTASLQSQIDNKNIVTVTQHNNDLALETKKREAGDEMLLSKFNNALSSSSNDKDINSAPEIKDARIASSKFKNTQYDTLGNAIRNQLDYLFDMHSNVTKLINSVNSQLQKSLDEYDKDRTDIYSKLNNVIGFEDVSILDQEGNSIVDLDDNIILGNQPIIKTDKTLKLTNIPADAAEVGHYFNVVQSNIRKVVSNNSAAIFGGDFLLSNSLSKHYDFNPEKGKSLGIVLKPDNSKDDFNSGMVESPSIIFDDTLQKYIMVYTAYDKVNHASIGYAYSDNLKDWISQGKLISPSGDINNGDKYGCTGPCLIKYDNEYYLFYLGLNGAGYEGQPINMCLAKSNNLKNWDYKGIVIPIQEHISWASNTIYHPCILRINGKWMIFFNANGNVNGIDAERSGYAYSNSLEGPYIVDPNRISEFAEKEGDSQSIQCGDPSIFKYKDLYYMFYFDIRSNGEVVDRYAWTTPYEFPRGWRYGGKVINQDEPYNKQYAHKPFCLIKDNVLYHYYTAVGDSGRCIALQTFNLN